MTRTGDQRLVVVAAAAWSLLSRFTVSGRRVTMIVGRPAPHWTLLAGRLALLPDPGG